MRTKVKGLGRSTKQSPLAEGFYRARVVRFGPAGHPAEPCVAATFEVLQPTAYAGRRIRTRLYCHERALWKLRWFLRAFKYNSELFERDELDDRHVVGLEGVIRLAYWGDARPRLDVQGFAFSERWGNVERDLGPDNGCAEVLRVSSSHV